MYLKRITLVGFKSFAAKTVLNLEPGVTAVVGPNGSGKSNLADAVRWALGEQSKTRLRLGDREEVVFAGTAARARASFAEVTLLFDNEDGTFPLEMTEVELSRRLYRSGETDYRLGRRSIRLADLQALLAQAGFGVSSYTVIGQGMIDTLLLSSPADRKLLFDEAAGIRGPELGRQSALRKLSATEANLTRLRDILAELTPRLESLGLATGDGAADQQHLEARVAELRRALVAAQLARWSAQAAAASDRLGHLATQLDQLHRDQAGLQDRLAAARAAEAKAAAARTKLQTSWITLGQDRDRRAAQLADQRARIAESKRAQAEAANLQQRLTAAQTEFAAAEDRLRELQAELASNTAAARRAADAVERATRAVAGTQATLVALREGTSDSTRDQYLDHALQILKTLAVDLGSNDVPLSQVRLIVHKIGRLLSHASRTGTAELLAELTAAQKQLEAAMAKRDTAIEHQTNITITARSLEIDLNHQTSAVKRSHEHLRQFETQLKPVLAAATRLPELEATAAHLADQLAIVTADLDQQRDQLAAMSNPSANLDAQVELAAGLERTKAALATAIADHQAAAAELAAATAGLAAARHQADTWQVADLADLPRPTATPDALQDQLLRAEAQLEARTAARQDQQAEYTAITTRHVELTTQIADLTAARADLERIVAQLDQLIRQRFKDNFQTLADQFSAYFTRLFDGGAASLELTEAEDGAYGVVIKASPKGKRPTALAALSGGERAMAGVALLAAILRVNPSPFVVLDEIDAALDEANSGRLGGILTELAAASQLIVITHNRQTMTAARVLFGVTLGAQHTSHLLSLRLEEAAQLAAR